VAAFNSAARSGINSQTSLHFMTVPSQKFL
jgi:hypothetical protein